MEDKEWTNSLSEEENQNQTGRGAAEEAKKIA